MGEKIRDLIARALDLAAFSASRLAEAAGLSRNTLAKWRTGDRSPTPASLRAVGEALIERGRAMVAAGEELVEAAQEVRRAADAEAEDGADAEDA